MLQAAVCDDEHNILSDLCVRIEAAFARHDMDARVYPFDSVRALTEQMQNNPFDVLFLDIDMPEMDGLELGIRIRSIGHDICIIFISNREDRVYEAFQVSPLRFIRKNRVSEEIDDAILAIQTWRNKRPEKPLIVMSSGTREIISLNDILYVEGLNKVQNITTISKTITVRYTMDFLEEKLPMFLKPHKSYLVNYLFIDYIKTDTIVLKNGIVIPISRHRITELKAEYLKRFSQSLPISAPPMRITGNTN